MSNSTSTRPTLGDFSSIVCFKAVIVGMEEALGEKATTIALTAAGRTRGKNLAAQLGLTGSGADLDTIAIKLNAALGVTGTRLTAIEKIVREGDVIKVYCTETICSAGEVEGSHRKCTFTLGAVWGALAEITGIKLRGTHTESVLRGGTHDVFEFTPVDRS
jgi:predicted hydrocarbon binding protein